MDEKITAFEELFNTEQVKKILDVGEKIKKLDKSNEKKLLGIILLSVIFMTVLGFISFGLTGSILFFAITVISSFWLFYSSKKNVLLKYLAFYRKKVPEIIAMAEGVDVRSEDVPYQDLIKSIHDGKPTFRMCHKYGEIYVGFLKFMSGDESILQGFAVCVNGKKSDNQFKEILLKTYPDAIIKENDGIALLFIPGFDDYLGGRVDMTDDLTLTYLVRQYRYFLLADAFSHAMRGESFDENTLSDI